MEKKNETLAYGGREEETNIINSVVQAGAEIIEKAIRLLLEYPLCDRCLGRLFALLGRGYTNAERGATIKRLIVQALHSRIRNGDKEATMLFKRLAPRLMPYSRLLYLELFGEEPEKEKCSICEDKLSEFTEKTSKNIISLINSKSIEASTFLIGVKLSKGIVEKENELRIKYRLEYAESIANELKREISKKLQSMTPLVPNFERPDIVIEVKYPEGQVEIKIQPLLLEGRYWKLARRISQTIWIYSSGKRKYPYSVEEALYTVAAKTQGLTAILHGSGREDVDVRMLGTGRPFILEVKEPRKRVYSKELLGRRVAIGRLVEAEVYRLVGRKRIAELKQEAEKHLKIYYAVIVSERDLQPNELKYLEEYFRNRGIKQRTPRRVRHRRPDIIRIKTVFEVSTLPITNRVFSALIKTEGGLYIKELVSGDDGDTSPSFAEILGARLYCASLDVVAVY